MLWSVLPFTMFQTWFFATERGKTTFSLLPLCAGGFSSSGLRVSVSVSPVARVYYCSGLPASVRPWPPSCEVKSVVGGLWCPPLEGSHRQGRATATRRTRTSATRRAARPAAEAGWPREVVTQCLNLQLTPHCGRRVTTEPQLSCSLYIRPS